MIAHLKQKMQDVENKTNHKFPQRLNVGYVTSHVHHTSTILDNYFHSHKHMPHVEDRSKRLTIAVCSFIWKVIALLFFKCCSIQHIMSR